MYISAISVKDGPDGAGAAVVAAGAAFREPWFRLQPEHALAFEREAEKEIAPGHVLHGIALSAVAKCDGCDDVVFRASDGTFAIVHLTWTLKPERPPRPQTTRLGSFIAVETAMDQHAH